jgi:hypothetical protein
MSIQAMLVLCEALHYNKEPTLTKKRKASKEATWNALEVECLEGGLCSRIWILGGQEALQQLRPIERDHGHHEYHLLGELIGVRFVICSTPGLLHGVIYDVL